MSNVIRSAAAERRRESAVGVQDRTGEVARLVGAQEQRRASDDVVRRPEPQPSATCDRRLAELLRATGSSPATDTTIDWNSSVST
jgi:hypothetical protein